MIRATRYRFEKPSLDSIQMFVYNLMCYQKWVTGVCPDFGGILK